MSLADYLAKNYLTKDSSLKPEKKKKRKRKDKEGKSVAVGGGGGGGIIIADDDIPGWDNSKITQDTSDNDGPVLDSTYSTSEFRKSKKQNWIIANPHPDPTPETQKASHSEEEEEETEEATMPQYETNPPELTMSNGSKAGLQTASEVASALASKRRAELSAFHSTNPSSLSKHAETIYRDASGRVVNIALARSEARKKAEEEESKKKAQLEKNKGEVQLRELQRRKEELAEAKYMSVARYKDDEKLNEELKEKELWNDPAAKFLVRKKSGKSVSGKPLYQGAWQPNRYGIRPGHNWDGVDRGNGFERKWFEARNKKRELKELAYAWEMDE